MSFTDPSDVLLSKYSKALGNAKMGLWQLDFASQVFLWDEGVRLLYELKEKKYQGNFGNWILRLHPEDIERVKAEFEEARLDKAELNTLCRLTVDDGSLRHIRVNAVKMRDEKTQKVTGLVGINWDVSNEYQLHAEVNKSKFFLEKILDAIPDPVFIKDREHRNIFANKEFEVIAGKPKTEMIGKIDSEFLPSQMADLYWNQDEDIFHNDKSTEFEETIEDSHGNRRFLLTKKTSLKMSKDETILVGVIRDITEIKNIQNSMIEQSKMASLGEMAAEIAHEINNPLMIIQAKSQILQEKLALNINQIDPEKLLQDLQSIEKNSHRIEKIIKSLKSVSRKADHDPFEEVSIRKIVEEAIEISKERLNKNQIRFQFTCDKIIDYGYLIKARPSEIVQVLMNMMNNSFDAIKGSQNPSVEISLRLVESIFHIEVVDSGPPIQPEVAKKMMEPFFTTKTSGAGTGLGLSVSKQIIQNHNGQLFYDGKAKNTKFVIQLKRAESLSQS